MPTYRIQAPDGNAYQIEGPPGAGDEQVRAEVLKQHPTAGVAKQAQTEKPPGSPSWGASAADFFKSIPRGAAEGLGSFVSLGSRMVDPESAMQQGMAGPVDPIAMQKASSELADKAVAGTIEKTGLPQPEGTAGQYGRAVGAALGNPLSYVGPGAALGKAATAIGGALGSEAAGQATEDDPSMQPYARIIGGAIGGMAPGMAARAITPFPTPAGRAPHVANLRAEGIEPTAGDISGNRSLKFAESALGNQLGAGGAYDAARDRIGGQYTRAALARMGETATEATPEVLDRGFRRIGQQFDTLAANTRAPYDLQYLRDIHQAQNEYDHLFVDPLRKPTAENVVQHATNKITQGRGFGSPAAVMDGAEYKALRSRIERMRRGQKSDPEMSAFLGSVRDAMDNLMERYAQNPDAWREVRRQYRNALVVEKAVTGAGEQAARGEVTPAKLRNAVVGQGRRAYGRGQGDFADLARSGEATLGRPPSSGTSERLHMNPLLWPSSLLSGLIGRGIMSGPGQAYLKNQVAAPAIQSGTFRGGGLRGAAVAGMQNLTPREQIQQDAKAALLDKKGYTKEQVQAIRAVAGGDAPVDTVIEVNRILKGDRAKPSYQGVN